MESVNQKIQKEKSAFVDRLLMLIVIYGSVGVAVSVSRALSLGFRPIMLVHITLLVYLSAIFLLRKKLSYNLKTISILVVFEIVALGGVWSFGLLGGQLFLLAVPLFVAIMNTSRYAVGVAILNGGLVVVFGILAANELISFRVDVGQYMKSFNSWLVVAIGLATVYIALIPYFQKSFSILNENLQKIELQREELRKVNNTQSKLFKVIAHDLKAPFNGLLRGLELIIADGDSMDTKHRNLLLNSTLVKSRNAYAILEDLLAWSQAQLGNVRLDEKDLHLEQLITACIEPYRQLLEKKQIDYQQEVPSGMVARGDEYTLKIVIRNLLHNAIKFTHSGGKVTVKARASHSGVMLSVADTGVGIEPKDVEKLFDFGETSTTLGTDGEPGTGLGLQIIYELLKKNGCELSVQSEPGQGTVFSTILKASA